MTARARLLCSLLLATLLLCTSSGGRGQGQTAQSSNTAAPAASQADIEAAVAALCKPADIIRSKNGNASGCKNCPEGTDFFGQHMGEWELRNSLSGHFTSAQNNDLILGGFHCDSHASNFGGSFIFSLKSGKPRLLKYDNGLVIEQCHKFRYADDRDFLVCRGGWSGQGEYDGYFFLTRFDATGKDSQTVIFSTRNTEGSCGDGSGGSVEGSDIKDAKFSATDSGELTGMTITATNGTITCAQAKVKRAPGEEPPSMKTYEIQFLFDGKQFSVAPASKAALRVFPQQ